MSVYFVPLSYLFSHKFLPYLNYLIMVKNLLTICVKYRILSLFSRMNEQK